MAEPSVTRVDVLVLGGGTSGTAAAWQAASMGARTLVVEETPWVGGMLTAAGVSAIDGNEGALGGGFYRRFRDAVEAHYGGAERVATGWVSNTCFEPKVAATLLKGWLDDAGAEVWHGARLVSVTSAGRRVIGAVVERDGERCEIEAAATIDATELGDGLALARAPYRLGRDARAETGEPDAPAHPDDLMQDLTWVAILRVHDGDAPRVPAPPTYDPRQFDGATAVDASTRDEATWNHALHDWDAFLSYGRLPGDRYMLNWPFHANDHPMSVAMFESAAERAALFARARARTLAFVHHMQAALGHPEVGVDEGAFPTDHGLAMIPYIRESRRLVGEQLVCEQDVVPAAGCPRPRFHRDSIAVGDYPLDHHHWRHHLPPGQRLCVSYPDTAPFQIPYGALVPADVDGLLGAEKNISVTHIANGCTRLQPVVLAIGQAAGAAAALAAKGRIEPREVDVRALQRTLLDDRAVLVPYLDVDPTHPGFAAVQTAGLSFDEREPLSFGPDDRVDTEDARYLAERLGRPLGDAWALGVTKAELVERLLGP